MKNGYDSSSQITVVAVHGNNAQNLCVALRHHLLTFSTGDETQFAPSQVAYGLQKTKSSGVCLHIRWLADWNGRYSTMPTADRSQLLVAQQFR